MWRIGSRGVFSSQTRQILEGLKNMWKNGDHRQQPQVENGEHARAAPNARHDHSPNRPSSNHKRCQERVRWMGPRIKSCPPTLPLQPKKMIFTILKSTKIARMYHSSAVLLPDGRVLVAGSNPNNKYTFRNVPHPTELRLQAFVPPHVGKEFNGRRPQNVSISTSGKDEIVGYGERFRVKFLLKTKLSKMIAFTVYASPFNTHSISMNQRMLVLRCKDINRTKDGLVNAVLEAPPSPKVAPSGYYMLTVLHNGIPSTSHWIKFIHT
ncbi:UNVERIFIED_CONTAM: Aldehyde oxidase GLOX1 [Sesamum latifolium]|uniref:Aldehyde oxidase GLOX1 n=1 Tax=Sesamum latifolium TaxID=2727402 RepID=A0AAW2UYH3_9LAMI